MIYLDNAATTLIKPAAVKEAAAWAMNHLASPGRGGHSSAMSAADTVYNCRTLAAELFNVPDPENVVITFNATHGLNAAIKSCISHGDKVVISGYEHNAVTRPLKAYGANVSVASSLLFSPEDALSSFSRLIDKGVSLVVCNHVSNVFGYTLPVYEIAGICRERNIPFILDASQSAGVLEVDFQRLSAAFVAMPGHKGLYGPQGTGLLLCGADAKPLLYGGTGSNSNSLDMPEFLPDILEAGTHNMPGIAGLLAGMSFIKARGIRSILAHEQSLTQYASEQLGKIRHITTFCDNENSSQSGVLSFVPYKIDVSDFAAQLDERGIAVRAGLHCSPLAHTTAGTAETGTVRISVSAFSTKRDIAAFLNAAEDIVQKSHI